ncbi:MAG: TetM/TetW/TetO/TetS family tetracycline resistance ribosomal protection protein [Clostridiales bacterium]|nr:TetM/TetW/TetO/TetS family tetracycline resistance ribosomal protection protein [Clostridiales bacterium]
MNIGIFAHVDAGKTTLTENLLYEAGAINSIGRVDNGNTVTDKMALEKKRGISIQSTPISFDYKNVKINLIDTPGHIEFVAEVERAMSVLDGAVLVISAKEGVQSHTTLLFESLRKLNKPVIIFINKMDRSGVDKNELIKDIKSDLCQNIIELQNVEIKDQTIVLSNLFDTHAIMEDLALYDDTLLEKYLNEEKINDIEIENSIKKLTGEKEIYPVCYGSALKNIGIKELLEAIEKLLPKMSPNSTGEVEGVVFKILRNDANKREIYIRLYSGCIRSRGMIKDEKISFVKQMKNGKLEYAKEAFGNDIAIIMGPEKLKVGDVIGNPKGYKKISLGTPTLRTRISSDNKRELAEIIDYLAEGDPFLEYEIEQHSKDLYLNLFGEIQMEIIQSLIYEKHFVKVSFSEPIIIYKEMPIALGEYTLYMWTGEHPFAATVGIRVEPSEEGLVIESDVSTGFLPQNFQNGIYDGISKALREGLKGWEVTNAKVTIIEGAFNSVDSTPSDYRDLTPIVVMEALNIADTKLLWPVNKFVMKIENKHYGKIMSDLLSMKATDIESKEDNNKFVITGKIPVETSLSYEKKFIAITSGMGMFSQVFYKYVESPTDIFKERQKNYVDPLNRGKYLLSKLRAY